VTSTELPILRKGLVRILWMDGTRNEIWSWWLTLLRSDEHFMTHKQNLFVMAIPSAAKKSDGFTLFEVLITLSILGVVLSLVYLTFHQSMAVMAETEDRAK